MTVTFPQGVLGVVPAFQLRNLQVYMYYPPPSPTLHGTVTSGLGLGAGVCYRPRDPHLGRMGSGLADPGGVGGLCE